MTPTPRRPPPLQRSEAALLVGPDGRPLACSEGYSRLFGPASAGLRAWDEQGQELTPERQPWRGLASGRQLRQTVTLETLSGARTRFEVSAQPMYDASGAISGGLLLFKAPSSGQTSRVAGLISHELRTPLTVLHAALQLLDRNLPSQPDTAARRYLSEAMAEARQLDVLTGQLIDAARLESGELQLRREHISLNALLQEAVARAEASSPGPCIKLQQPARELFVDADRLRLNHMLMSLLVNALMYAPGAECVDVRLHTEDAEALVDVRDYGPGIEPQGFEHVAEPFYQAPRRERPSRGGLGLSLYLCRELARLHGGDLDIATQTGQGSTFTLRLPLARSAASSRVREDVAPMRAPRRRRA